MLLYLLFFRQRSMLQRDGRSIFMENKKEKHMRNKSRKTQCNDVNVVNRKKKTYKRPKNEKINETTFTKFDNTHKKIEPFQY